MIKTTTLTQRYRRWQAYRRTVRELSSLSRAELSDIGLTPETIPSIARQAAARDGARRDRT